tara:strand:- start:316 stop:516 length:201 start_codon:yes stop_codon:yes gene_type:complete
MISEYRRTVIEWKDSPGERFQCEVGINASYVGGLDDNVFFYFDSEQQYQDAKKADGDYEFRIMEES